jgi:hypothetical protein
VNYIEYEDLRIANNEIKLDLLKMPQKYSSSNSGYLKKLIAVLKD